MTSPVARLAREAEGVGEGLQAGGLADRERRVTSAHGVALGRCWRCYTN